MKYELDHEQKLHLMKFVCSFAWADLEVVPDERTFVRRLAESLGLDAADDALIEAWLKVPPTVDPMAIPTELRPVYLAAIDGVISADGEIAPEEQESLKLLQELLGEA